MNLDFYLFNKINGLAGSLFWLDVLAIFFAKYLSFLLIILVMVLFWKRWEVIFQSLLAGIVARLGFVEIIRFFWPKPRPFVENHVNLLLDKIDQSAFPSGHAAFFFALSFVVFLDNKKAGMLFFVASFFIAISRVFVGIHWPSDLIAGMIVGIFSGWLVIFLAQKIFSTSLRRLPRSG